MLKEKMEASVTITHWFRTSDQKHVVELHMRVEGEIDSTTRFTGNTKEKAWDSFVRNTGAEFFETFKSKPRREVVDKGATEKA